MKKTAASVVALLMTFSLAACAGSYSTGGSQLKVKCPACGYEFETVHLDK
ncbi:MAG: hypothetical protein IH614_07175 [Desulfuromonadales bacterium]|nr:hypothetical protein [Desulfuromonadales bacterium]